MLFLKNKKPHKPSYVGLFFPFLPPHFHFTDGCEYTSQVKAQEVTLFSLFPRLLSEKRPYLNLKSNLSAKFSEILASKVTPQISPFRKTKLLADANT